ncbi:MAG: DUF47 family protein [Candidatus Diapherotrites archaeon]|nr:DUF47 family protein [Candidatus Diapherotrites archaeon]
MGRILGFFLPKEPRFFELFQKQSQTLLDASREFHFFLKKYNSLENGKKTQIIRRLGKLESLGDTQSREIIELLHESLVTPYDREDVHTLTVLLDDILDSIDGTSRKMVMYRIHRIPKTLSGQADTFLEMAETINSAIANLESLEEAQKMCTKIYALEHKADKLYEDSISHLFNGGFKEKEKAVIEVIKFKDIYEEMENAFDKGKTLADIVQTIVVKHG